jgi:DNA-binding cell septation regulator SpoVG
VKRLHLHRDGNGIAITADARKMSAREFCDLMFPISEEQRRRTDEHYRILREGTAEEKEAHRLQCLEEAIAKLWGEPIEPARHVLTDRIIGRNAA